MAVFRIEKTRDYTVMSNHHLRNTDLSLKAKGLLSLMLSLPEPRTYTVEQIAAILNIGRTTAYQLVKEEQFRIVRIGNAIRVSKKSFDEWLERLEL